MPIVFYIWLATAIPLFALWVFLIFRHLFRLAMYIRPTGQDNLGGVASQQKARNRASWEYLKANRKSFLFIAILTVFNMVYNGVMLGLIGEI